jgi:hypothetical protein
MRTERQNPATLRSVASGVGSAIQLAWGDTRRRAMSLVRGVERKGVGDAAGEAANRRLIRRTWKDGGFTAALLRDTGP